MNMTKNEQMEDMQNKLRDTQIELDAIREECAELHDIVADYQNKRARPAAKYSVQFLPHKMIYEQHTSRAQELRALINDLEVR